MLGSTSLEWNEARLRGLVGETESLRLEFKSSRMFDKGGDAWKDDISAEISAFANSEGGSLVLGVEEDHGTPRRAVAVEGLLLGRDYPIKSPESLQRIIEDRISPRIPGLRVIAIPLRGLDEGRMVLVIQVPQGTTAHQAVGPCIYFGRAEFEVRRLQDRDVRLRMERARAPRLEIVVQGAERLRLLTEEEQRQRSTFIRFPRAESTTPEERAEAAARASALPKYEHGAIQFGLGIKNTGEITIREFALEFTPTFPRGYWIGPGNVADAKHMPTHDSPTEVVHIDANERLFPGQLKLVAGLSKRASPVSFLFLWAKAEPVISESCTLGWRAFLDNAAPLEGEIVLAEALSAAFSRPEPTVTAGEFEPEF